MSVPSLSNAGVPEPVASPELQEMVATDNSVFQQLLDDTRRIKVVSRTFAVTLRMFASEYTHVLVSMLLTN